MSASHVTCGHDIGVQKREDDAATNFGLLDVDTSFIHVIIVLMIFPFVMKR